MNPAEYCAAHAARFEAELCELLRVPSVSTDGRHGAELRQAAEWLVGQLRGLGLSTDWIETEGNPILLAESPPVPGAPVALVYGHYDVQPPEPLDEWRSPPFEPTVRDGNLYARGATDDKGQMFTHVKSVEAWLKTAGALPLQVKFLLEGEEEVGSKQLYRLLDGAFLPRARERLACDVVVISDTSQFAPGRPAITYGLRGIAYFELRLSGPRQDLHSGTFGGGVVNPANALAGMLAALKDDQGRVRVPGFYDDVVPLSPRERAEFAKLPFDEERFARQLGVSALGGEAGYSTLERRWARPTCDVNGLWSGYQGPGAKTILPASAGAKLSFRLVPRQDPAKIAANLKSFFEQNLPPGTRMELLDLNGSPAVLTPLDSPGVEAARRAITRGFGVPPVFIREGGSIPIVAAFKAKLGADSLLLGWGLDDDNTHGPNEKFCLADFHRGILASAALWGELAAAGGPPGAGASA